MEQAKKTILPIVVKFAEECHSSSQKAKSAIAWPQIHKKFGGVGIQRLIKCVSMRQLTNLLHRARIADRGYTPADLLSFYVISCPADIDPHALLQELQQRPAIRLAYIETGFISPPTMAYNRNQMSDQGYLDDAPVGIGARHAWQMKGGDGRGKVKFIDIEQGWLLDHEYFKIKPLKKTGINHDTYGDHGAAVLGVIMMRNNKLGRKGISPRVKGHVISQWRVDGSLNLTDAIAAAIQHLSFGDVLLIESQCMVSLGSSERWPVEAQEAVFEMVRLATALGIIVVVPAGNGNLDSKQGADLDRFVWNDKEVLNRHSADFRDSGAIVVGAGSANVPHERLEYSNYGSRVDCYAWGERVSTVGRSHRAPGCAIDVCRTDFGGTSSAAAIIAGTAIAVQSVIEANFNRRIGPKRMRALLSTDLHGTQSANGRACDKIGSMPDLEKILPQMATILPLRKSIGISSENACVDKV